MKGPRWRSYSAGIEPTNSLSASFIAIPPAPPQGPKDRPAAPSCRAFRQFRLTFRLECSYYVLSPSAHPEGGPTSHGPRRSIFDIVYQAIPNGATAPPEPARPEECPLTSFTWGCSSDSKKLRSQFLTYA